MDSLNLVDEIREVEKGNKEAYKELSQKLRKKRWDFIFAPHESFRTAKLVFSLPAKEKIGFKKWWNAAFFTRRVSRRKDLPDALRQLRLFSSVDAVVQQRLS